MVTYSTRRNEGVFKRYGFEVIDRVHVTSYRALSALAAAYKEINAPLGKLGFRTLTGISTAALSADDATYAALEAQIRAITARRNEIAGQMIDMLEDAAFDHRPIDEDKAWRLIGAAGDLLASVPAP